jgi:SOS-response transcriptional repressor LexA
LRDSFKLLHGEITVKASLTTRQVAVLNQLREFIKAHGYSPTVRELMKPLGIVSTNGIKVHLDALRAKGVVTWQEGKPRTLRLL